MLLVKQLSFTGYFLGIQSSLYVSRNQILLNIAYYTALPKATWTPGLNSHYSFLITHLFFTAHNTSVLKDYLCSYLLSIFISRVSSFMIGAGSVWLAHCCRLIALHRSTHIVDTQKMYLFNQQILTSKFPMLLLLSGN